MSQQAVKKYRNERVVVVGTAAKSARLPGPDSAAEESVGKERKAEFGNQSGCESKEAAEDRSLVI